MIEKREIMERAKATNIPITTIEKDYVIGWFLAAIQHRSDLAHKWIFKGGTCLKKCYFADYRFSEDLDFSLSDSSHMNEGFLEQTFLRIIEWLYEKIGLEIPKDRIKIDIYENHPKSRNAQVTVKFCGPLRPKSKTTWPIVKFDLTGWSDGLLFFKKRN